MELSNGFNVERRGSAILLRFTRPEIRNPLSVSVLDALTDVVLSLDENVGALILTGSDDVFASGADLREIAEVTGTNAAEFAQRGQQLMHSIASLKAKTIAAVNGKLRPVRTRCGFSALRGLPLRARGGGAAVGS